MKKAEIKVGGMYLAKVSGMVTTVRVDKIRQSPNGRTGEFAREITVYDVTNVKTGRSTTFRSAAKFRIAVTKEQAEERMKLDKEVHIGYWVKQEEERKDKAHTEFDATVQERIELAPQEEEICESCGASSVERWVEDDWNCFKCNSCGTSGSVCMEDEQRSDPTTPMVDAKTATDPSTQTASEASAAQIATSLAQGAMTVVGSLAGKIASSRIKREVGTPVAGMVPNDEQEDILALAEEMDQTPGQGRVMVVVAGAGTGKTATLKMLEQVMTGRGQYTAFNTSLVAESKTKFVKAACNTTHSLAFRAVGKLYQHRLGAERMRSGQVARILGIENMVVILKGAGAPDEEGKPTDKTKTLQAEWLAGQVMTALRKFMGSADREVGEHHFHYTDGLDVPEDGNRTWTNNNLVRAYLLPFARKAWDDLRRLDGQLPFSHDAYVKIWQLGEGPDRPIIAADYILLDEDQDTAPVFLDVLMQQKHALLIMVGDDNQQIYEWRGAVNATKAFPHAPRRLLSQSYRFGQAIADVANTILGELEVPTDLVMRGHPDIPSRIDEVADPRCYLYRTNAGAITRVMVARKEGKRPHLIGKCDDIIAWCQAALDLQAKRGTRFLELACFDTWEEVQEYSKSDEGGDLRLMVKLIDDFGAQEIRDALKDMPKEADADLVISTAHRSKGREWDTVRLGPDFPTANKMSDADIRLLYVAATRAKMTLDVSECPPFCGAYDDSGEERRWIPGLRIEYTVPMPTASQQAMYLSLKGAVPKQFPNVGINDSGRMVTEAPRDEPTDQEIADITKPKFSWRKYDNGWCVQGAINTPIGTQVQVERRDGSKSMVTIRGVAYKNTDTWIYKV